MPVAVLSEVRVLRGREAGDVDVFLLYRRSSLRRSVVERQGLYWSRNGVAVVSQTLSQTVTVIGK